MQLSTISLALVSSPLHFHVGAPAGPLSLSLLSEASLIYGELLLSGMTPARSLYLAAYVALGDMGAQNRPWISANCARGFGEIQI